MTEPLPSALRQEGPQQAQSMTDAAEMLWIVLANVSGGDWTKQSADWQEAAARWRDNYFAALSASRTAQAVQTCDSCVHLTPFELAPELCTCPVVNIRIHRESASVFGCNQHEPHSATSTVTDAMTESAALFKKIFVPVTYEPCDGDRLAVRMCKKIYNLTAFAKFHGTPISPDELRTINSAAFAGLEGEDEIEALRTAQDPQQEGVDLVTRLIDYRGQVLNGFRHISRFDEAELIQAAIDGLRHPGEVRANQRQSTAKTPMIPDGLSENINDLRGAQDVQRPADLPVAPAEGER